MFYTGNVAVGGGSEALAEPVGPKVSAPFTEEFITYEHYRVGSEGEVPIEHLDPEFQRCLLAIIERNIAAALMAKQKLLWPGKTEHAVESLLGGQERAGVALAHIFEYLKTAERDQWLNFLVVDEEGVLRRLVIFWHCHGWWIKLRRRDDKWFINDHLISYH